MIIDEDIYLEHSDNNRTIDQEVDVFLEHFGVLGMKWGVRRERRANRFAKVGRGAGNKSEKLRSYTDLGPIDFVKGRGLRGGAARKGYRLKNANKNIKAGKATVRNILTYGVNTRHQDIFPTSKKSTNTQAAVGATIAAAVLFSVGKSYLNRE
jgi:hypothetical protein